MKKVGPVAVKLAQAFVRKYHRTRRGQRLVRKAWRLAHSTWCWLEDYRIP